MVAFLDRVEAAGDAPTRGAMTKVTVEPITVTINGLSSEVGAGPHNELDDDCGLAARCGTGARCGAGLRPLRRTTAWPRFVRGPSAYAGNAPGNGEPGQAGSVTTRRLPRGAASETRTVEEIAMAARSRPAAASTNRRLRQHLLSPPPQKGPLALGARLTGQNGESPGQIRSDRDFPELRPAFTVKNPWCARGDLNPHALSDTGT